MSVRPKKPAGKSPQTWDHHMEGWNFARAEWASGFHSNIGIKNPYEVGTTAHRWWNNGYHDFYYEQHGHGPLLVPSAL